MQHRPQNLQASCELLVTRLSYLPKGVHKHGPFPVSEYLRILTIKIKRYHIQIPFITMYFLILTVTPHILHKAEIKVCQAFPTYFFQQLCI